MQNEEEGQAHQEGKAMTGTLQRALKREGIGDPKALVASVQALGLVRFPEPLATPVKRSPKANKEAMRGRRRRMVFIRQGLRCDGKPRVYQRRSHIQWLRQSDPKEYERRYRHYRRRALHKRGLNSHGKPLQKPWQCAPRMKRPAWLDQQRDYMRAKRAQQKGVSA